MTKKVDERIDEGVLGWFCHVERVENDKIARNTNRVYVGKHLDSHSEVRQRKRWIDTVKYCLKKRGLDVRQTRGMAHDRSVWWGGGNETMTLTRCFSCELQQL